MKSYSEAFSLNSGVATMEVENYMSYQNIRDLENEGSANTLIQNYITVCNDLEVRKKIRNMSILEVIS